MGDIYAKVPAHGGINVAAKGEFIYCRTTTAAFHVLIEGQDFEFGEGDKLRIAGGFDGFRLENSTGSDITAELIVGNGDYSRRAMPSINFAKPQTLATVADVSLAAGATTQIAAANSSRREIHITNLPGNTQTIRIGDVNAGAARGTPVMPGDTYILTTTAAVYGYNPGAGAESVAVLTIAD